jgi:hypothetical protein
MPCTLTSPCLGVVRVEAVIGPTTFYRCGNAHTLREGPEPQIPERHRRAASRTSCLECGMALSLASKKTLHDKCRAVRKARGSR